MPSRIGGQLWKPGAQAPTVVGGRTFTPVAYYPSSSNPKNGYTVCEVNDGTVSCNCMGWTRRNPPGGRTCKHTEDYLMFLKPERDALASGKVTVAAAAPEPERPNPARGKERGGSLSELFKKLDKEAERGD